MTSKPRTPVRGFLLASRGSLLRSPIGERSWGLLLALVAGLSEKSVYLPCPAFDGSQKAESPPEGGLSYLNGWPAGYRKGRARNSLITTALMMSMKKAPTMGTTRKARWEGPKRWVMACMLAMAVGVAPRPKPQ